jgi:uncharacterized membrane protein YcaP (DUF421 family)
MEYLFSIDWHRFFVPEHSILEMFVRGTVMYLVIFIFLRLIGRRINGSIGTADLLVIVMIADAAQNGMAHEYKSVTEGIALVATILLWDFILDWLSFRSPALRPLLSSPALPLVKNGVLQRANLRREMITREELMSQLREQGLESYDKVKLALLEGDGHISVIKTDGRSGEKGKKKDTHT